MTNHAWLAAYLGLAFECTGMAIERLLRRTGKFGCGEFLCWWTLAAFCLAAGVMFTSGDWA